MSTARPSVTKRQREQVKRDRQARKAEKRAERKNNPNQTEEETFEPLDGPMPFDDGTETPAAPAPGTREA
ncbi:MAG: hypothetical protein QOH21_3034 [Acidobacteriota bacterium]|jgi:hypothetical protein|nr:hypothetical protein [Acidobacteriota bacterium]